MLLFFHLFIGLAAGFILALIFKNKKAIIFCGLGGILPDLIDKPLGEVFLADSLDFGRIYFHTILIVLIILAVGIFIRRYNKKSVALICIAVGMFLHQLGDFMWESLQNWMWPFMGPFTHVEEIYTIPEGAEILLDIAAWIISVITALAVIYFIYRLLPEKLYKGSKPKTAAIICFEAVIAVLTTAAMRYLIMDFFLGGSNGDYFSAMFLHELAAFSEWIFGFVSLILLIVIILFAKQVSKAREEKVYKICGAVCIAAAAAIPVLWIFGINLDAVYGFPTQIVGVIGLLFGGVVLLFMRKKVSDLQNQKN
ncbi:MAG: metal-dependent hydrolase [Methanocorpusculum sp.]|nr:metal-dependent hydrolase [Methanocorpusculum sp.]